MIDYTELIKQLEKNIQNAKHIGSKTAVLQIQRLDDGKDNELFALIQSVASKDFSCFQLKRDLYAVLMPKMDEAKEAATLAHQLIFEALKNYKVNVGIAVFPYAGDTAHDLAESSREAVEVASKIGTGVFRFYRPEVHMAVEKRIAIEAGVQNVLADDRLFLEFQPKVDLNTGKVTGAEALVRWQHPEYGVIGPNDFMSIVSNTDYIFDIGQWVLEKAIIGFKQLNIKAPFRLSVNLAPKQLTSYYVVDMIISLLEKHDMDPANLALEITENEMLKDLETHKKKLLALAAKKIQILVDDYGTGYASLMYLHKLPIGGVKLDKAFVDDVATDKTSQVIVKSTIEMARALGMRVIAEGIETKEQMQLLKEFGCHEGQGFLISKSLSIEAFINFYRQHSDLLNK